MGEPEGRLEEEIAARLASRASGALEVSDGRKRWIFYLRDGQLVFTRSNLKSETAEAIKGTLAAPTRSGIILAQASRRLANALKAPGTTARFLDGTAAPKALPIPTTVVVLTALREARSSEELLALVAPLRDGWPRLVDGELVDLGGSSEPLEAYLNDLDGAQAGADVIEFAPGDQLAALAALWLSWRMGWVEPGAPPVVAPTEPSSDLDLGFDLGALLAEEAAPLTAAPAPEVEEPAEEAERETHPMEGRLLTLTERVNSAENHFEILGLPWDAPIAQFRAAYRDLARDLHPDRYVTAPESLQELATEVFDKIRAAWEVVGDEEERQKYIDKVIHGKKTEEELAMEQLQAYWSAESDFKKGLAAFNQGKLTAAHEFFTHAVDAAPDELEFKAYYAYTSFSLIRATDPERAQENIDLLKNVIERNQEQERKLDNAWVLLGRAYRESEQPDKAKRCFVQALRINVANADAIREMRRLTSGPTPSKKSGKSGGFFSRLFGKK